MRTIFLSKKSVNYLCKTVDEHKLGFGIIIGQKTSDEKYYAIHLAKLSDDDEHATTTSQDTATTAAPFESVGVQLLAEQWISASKMTPGSFSVIGVFLAHGETSLDDENHTKSIKKLLGELNGVIAQNSSSLDYSEHSRDSECIFLSYCTSSSNASCKVYSNSTNGGNLIPVDCKVVDKLPQWYLFESNYELDDVFPITENRQQVNIENQFKAALHAVEMALNNSQIFIQRENLDDNITLEAYLKEHSKKNDLPVFNASILLTANLSNEFLVKIRQFNGTIRFAGIVSSRVWCHAKNTFKEVKESIRKDILRSLAARIQMYCDGLTDLHSHNGGIVVSEPPRRIYFSRSKSQGIQFSEYIFRGETPSVAVAQAKHILDVDIDCDCIFDDLEGLHDDDLSSSMSSEVVTPNNEKSPGNEISRSMYMLGIAAALLVLLISVLLHHLFVQVP